MPKKYYKVVSNNLTSVVMCKENTGLEKTYKINEWVYADADLIKLGYGLFVFDSLHMAKIMAGHDAMIYECRIKERLKKSIKVFNVLEVKKQDILDKKHMRYDTPVFGTVIVKAVMLTRRVKNVL